MAEQLRLWPDDDGQVIIQCTHCGGQFDASPQLKQHQAAMEARVLTHPRVRALPARTQDFLAAALPAFHFAPEAGVCEIARSASYSPSGAYWQIDKLVSNHVFKRVPKGEKYSLYRLAI